jgi:hypothetical protein
VENQFVCGNFKSSGYLVRAANRPHPYKPTTLRADGPAIFNNDNPKITAADANFSPAANGPIQAA